MNTKNNSSKNKPDSKKRSSVRSEAIGKMRSLLILGSAAASIIGCDDRRGDPPVVDPVPPPCTEDRKVANSREYTHPNARWEEGESGLIPYVRFESETLSFAGPPILEGAELLEYSFSGNFASFKCLPDNGFDEVKITIQATCEEFSHTLSFNLNLSVYPVESGSRIEITAADE